MFLNIFNSALVALKSKVLSTLSSNTISSTSGRQYAVQLDKDGYLSVNVPWTDNNTTYSSGTGISISGTTINNSGVRSISDGSTDGAISVNTGGNTANVSVHGLKSAAYTESSAYAAANHNQAASTITAGTLAGRVQANASAASALGNAQVRDIYIGTEAMTAGTTNLTAGTIYLQYE